MCRKYTKTDDAYSGSTNGFIIMINNHYSNIVLSACSHMRKIRWESSLYRGLCRVSELLLFLLDSFMC